MKSRIYYPLIASVISSAACRVFAQDDSPEPAGWHFRIGPHVQFNYRVSIHDSFVQNSAGQYDNGFVKPDFTGNTNTTSYFSYTPTATTINNYAANSGTLLLNRFEDVPRAGDLTGKNQTAFGGEVSAAYELSSFRVWKKREAHIGFEVGYGFTSFDVTGSSTAIGTAKQITAAYGLANATFTTNSYIGNNSSSGGNYNSTLLNLNPSSVTTALFPGAQNTFSAKTSVDLNSIKLGPWIDLPLTSKLNLHISAGYCAVFAQAEIDANDTLTGVTLDPTRQPPGAYHAAKRNWEPGMYGQLRLEYEFTERWGAYLGADFQHNQNLSFETAGRKFDIQMGSAFGASAGVRFSF